MQIKTDQFAEAARAALKDTYTRIFLDGMHLKVKEIYQAGPCGSPVDACEAVHALHYNRKLVACGVSNS